MLNKKLIPILLLLALALGIVSYRSVSAQAPTPTPETPSQDGPGRPRTGFERGVIQGETLDEDLAAALGIEVEALVAARQTAADAAIEQAVSQGLITQEQADALGERGTGKLPRGGKGRLAARTIDYDAFLADALGITVEQLQEAHSTAFNTRLERAVADGRLSEEQAGLMRAQQALAGSQSFQSSMQAAYEAAVQQAVSEGLISQDQADQILQNGPKMNFFGRRGLGGFHKHGLAGPDLPLPSLEPEADS